MQRKTTIEHWDTAWAQRPRPRLPTGLEVGTKSTQEVLRRGIRPGMKVLEIGCAPGKMLGWVAKGLGADVSGIDYSPRGVEVTRWLLGEMGVDGDIRQEDVFETSFAPGSFDVVYSNGVIEHFEDPRELVAIHVRLLRPGGTAIILIPNYGGIYGRLQHRFDPENLAIHNLAIMSEGALRDLAPRACDNHVAAYRTGLPSPWIVSWQRRWGRIGRLFSWTMNMVSLAVPVRVPALSPLLVLEIRRAQADAASRTPMRAAHQEDRRCN